MNLISFIISIPTFDSILCFIFGKKARWYQLHVLFNIYVSYYIAGDVYNIITDPNNGYTKQIKDDNISYSIVLFHLYHLTMYNSLNFYDFFHHILFVLFGVLPNILFIKSNQKNLGYIVCSGVPGVIEYSLMFLFKHDLITAKTCKKYIYMLYLFLRYPLCIFIITYNMLAHYNRLIDDWLQFSLYCNALVYFNGAIFTHLNCKSFYKRLYIF